MNSVRERLALRWKGTNIYRIIFSVHRLLSTEHRLAISIADPRFFTSDFWITVLDGAIFHGKSVTIDYQPFVEVFLGVRWNPIVVRS